MAKGNRRHDRSARSRSSVTGGISKGLGSALRSTPLSRSLRLEQLEDRRMLATFVVNNLGDLNADQTTVTGSLRNAVEEANANDGFDTIMFADFLFDDVFGSTIFLDGRDAGGALNLTDIAGVEIIGPGAAAETASSSPLGRLTIVAGGGNRIFVVNDGNDDRFSAVTISGVTLSSGNPAADDLDGLGGAIHNSEFMTLTEVELLNNFAPGGGGAVHNAIGNLTIENSLIRGNTSRVGGGGVQTGEIDQDDNLPTTTIVNSTITGNTALGVVVDDTLTGYGGGVYNRAGTTNIEQSTIYGNTASVSGGGIASRGFDAEREDAEGTGDNVPPVTEDFESGDFTLTGWNTAPAGSIAPWTVVNTDPNTGLFSAKSGEINNNEVSALQITLATGEGDVTFFRKVSSLSPGDQLRFFIDGAEQGVWTGEVPYAMESFAVTEGVHTFRWEYSKDATGVSGSDAAFIDDLSFPGAAAGGGGTGEPTVFSGLSTTNIRSSIIVGNSATLMGMPSPDDVGSSGMTEDDPPVPFEPQINSFGYNIFGVVSHAVATANPDVTLPPLGINDVNGVDPTSIFIDDPSAMVPTAWLNDFGGVLPVFMPDINKIDPGVGANLAIDRGDPAIVAGPADQSGSITDQRGYQFARAADPLGVSMMPIMDIGAAEVQIGNFIVDTVVDESDGRYANVAVSEGTFPFNLLTFVPDFSLREALEFVEKNALAGLTDTSTITFSDALADKLANPDPTASTTAQTILLTQGQLFTSVPVIIEGPASFELEIDAAGNDFLPAVPDGGGSRILTVFAETEISNLILRGGDVQEFGGAILVFDDLTLRNVTVSDNSTTGDGAGIYLDGGNLLLETSTINNNEAARSGAGIFVASGGLTVSNSTISGNISALNGGGIANYNGAVLVQYSTITENSAFSTLGSGIVSYRDGTATTEIRSSIISGNAVNDVQHFRPGADNIISLGYNLIGDGNAVLSGAFSAAGDQTFTDAMLAPLARLGGPTAVHRLLPGSPAIDAGDPNAAGLGNVPDFEQRGFPFERIEGGVRIDIGSFEVQEDVLLVGDVLGLGGAPDPDAGFATFVDALNESNLTPTTEMIVFLPSWPGEFFAEDLLISDSVDVIGGNNGFRFFGANIIIDDSDATNLLEVSFDSLRFDTNTHVDNYENLTFTNMDFVDNAGIDPNTFEPINGGAISHQNGKLTISDSSFIGNSSPLNGGAVYVDGGDLEINNSFISGSSTGISDGSGGAIFINNGEFTSNYLYLTGNVSPGATGMGGGFYAKDATVTLTNAFISGNATAGSNSDGGAIAGINSDITLVDSTVSFNTTIGTQSSGGAIYVAGGSLDIQNSSLALNRTFGQDSSGGAIGALDADVTITGSSFSTNEVNGFDAHGGTIYSVDGNLEIRDSSVINSVATHAGSNGGAIFTDKDLSGSQNALIINSTISGSEAANRGGGVYNAGGLLQVKYSTITDNTVPFFGNGGGVASYGSSSTTRTEVSSSIIAGNFSENDPVNPNSDVESVGGVVNSFVSLGYNVIGKGVQFTLDAFTAIGDQVNIVDPGLDNLTFDTSSGTFFHALQEDSPAVNAGNKNAVAGVGDVPEFDQRGTGFSRVFSAVRIDAGAIESDWGPLVPLVAGPDFDNDGDVDGSDFLSWQRGFGIASGADPTDGDANDDGAVTAEDLTIWSTDYGNLTIAAAAAGDGGGSLLAPLSGSEPLLALAVFSPDANESAPAAGSALLAGLAVDGGSSNVAASFEQAPVASTAVVSSSAKDRLFEDLAPLGHHSSFEELGSTPLNSEGEEADLETTVEDQFFELLGSDVI